MVELGLALIAAAGSVATAYVIHVVSKTRQAVNGRVDELVNRVRLLEQLLAWSEPEDPRDTNVRSSRPTDL